MRIEDYKGSVFFWPLFFCIFCNIFFFGGLVGGLAQQVTDCRVTGRKKVRRCAVHTTLVIHMCIYLYTQTYTYTHAYIYIYTYTYVYSKCTIYLHIDLTH